MGSILRRDLTSLERNSLGFGHTLDTLHSVSIMLVSSLLPCCCAIVSSEAHSWSARHSARAESASHLLGCEVAAGALQLTDGTVILSRVPAAVHTDATQTGALFLGGRFDADRPTVDLDLGALTCRCLHLHSISSARGHRGIVPALARRRLLGLARVSRYWMAPAFGHYAGDVPHDCQFLLLELSGAEAPRYALPLLRSVNLSGCPGYRMRKSICIRRSVLSPRPRPSR